MTEKHWSYGSGSVGCLYDNGPCFAESERAAIDGALFIFDHLPGAELKRARRNLRNDGIHYFTPRYRADAGADYVEVVEQQGPCPESDE